MRTLTNQPSVPSKAKNLRNQLIARSMGMNPFGFFPQQHGNVNEQRLRELQQNNQMMIDKNNRDAIANEALKKENEDLKQKNQQLFDEGKLAKKELKKAKREYERAKDQHMFAEDDLEETKNVHDKLVRENEKQQKAQMEAMQIHAENEELKLQPRIDGLESRIHVYRIAQEDLKKQININQKYEVISTKQKELDIIKAQNAAMKEIIDSPMFQDPNSSLKETYRRIEEEKYKNDLLQRKIDAKHENIKLTAQLQSMADPSATEAFTKEIIERTKKLNTESEEIKVKIKLAQEPINDLEYAIDKYKKSKYAKADSDFEESALESRIDVIDKLAPHKNMEETLKNNAQALGQQQASTDKAKKLAQNAEQKLDLEIEEVKDKAYNEELNKDLDSDLKDEAQKNGQVQANNEVQNELHQSIKDRRKAEFEAAKVRSNNEYMNSPQVQNYTKQIIDNETKAEQLQTETEHRDLMLKTQKHLQQAQISNAISANTTGNEMPPVEAINYIVENEVQPRINEEQEKELLLREVNQYSQTYQPQWGLFLSNNPQMQQTLSSCLNAPTNELKDAIAGFKQFLRSSNPKELFVEEEEENDN